MSGTRERLTQPLGQINLDLLYLGPEIEDRLREAGVVSLYLRNKTHFLRFFVFVIQKSSTSCRAADDCEARQAGAQTEMLSLDLLVTHTLMIQAGLEITWC